MTQQADIKSFIKEQAFRSLCENAQVRSVVLQDRLKLIKEAIELDEASFVDKARQWLRDKFYKSEKGAKDYVGQNLLVNPEKLTSDSGSVEKILQSAISAAKKETEAFKSSTLNTSTKINNLQEKIFDLFGKFFNLLDSLPEDKRGLYEREVMKVVAIFYTVLEEEKKRIEVYLKALEQEVQGQGYNLAASAREMARFRPEAPAKVVGTRVVEPETNTSPEMVGAPVT